MMESMTQKRKPSRRWRQNRERILTLLVRRKSMCVLQVQRSEARRKRCLPHTPQGQKSKGEGSTFPIFGETMVLRLDLGLLVHCQDNVAFQERLGFLVIPVRIVDPHV